MVDLKPNGQFHEAYCSGTCSLCGKDFLGDKLELVLNVKERYAGGAWWFSLVHALCWATYMKEKEDAQ